MDINDIKIGMKVRHGNYCRTMEVVSFDTQYELVYCKHQDYTLPLSFNVRTLDFAEPPEFTWDKSVPTVGEPFKHTNGSWYIKIDDSKPKLFEQPIEVYSSKLILLKLCAVVPNSSVRYIFTDGFIYACDGRSYYLPVTYTPKELEVTVDVLKEFYEKQNNIKVKVIAE